MHYLYIFEDGTMLQKHSAPTEEDLESVDDGVLTIVRYVDDMFQDVSSDEIWNDISVSE